MLDIQDLTSDLQNLVVSTIQENENDANAADARDDADKLYYEGSASAEASFATRLAAVLEKHGLVKHDAFADAIAGLRTFDL